MTNYFQKIFCAQNDEPFAVVPTVGDDRYLLAGISDRLLDPVVRITALDKLNFPMYAGQVVAYDVGRVTAAGKLLTSSRGVTLLAQLVAPLPFPATSFGSAVHRLTIHSHESHALLSRGQHTLQT
jgi:hypothetical protein